MLYISKGVVMNNSTEQNVRVMRCGMVYQMTGNEARIWLDGRFGFQEVTDASDKWVLERLTKMSLVEIEETDSDVSRYRILCRCVCAAAKTKWFNLPVGGAQKDILIWLRNAGLRLSTAELVCLLEKGIRPEARYLHADNRQALVELIYMVETIADNVLENQMENATQRDAVVHALEMLLRKKKIVIL
jgi:hypothetical protein